MLAFCDMIQANVVTPSKCSVLRTCAQFSEDPFMGVSPALERRIQMDIAGFEYPAERCVHSVCFSRRRVALTGLSLRRSL